MGTKRELGGKFSPRMVANSLTALKADTTIRRKKERNSTVLTVDPAGDDN